MLEKPITMETLVLAVRTATGGGVTTGTEV